MSITARSVVDERKLEQRSKNERQTYAGPDIDGLGVANWWQRRVDTRNGGGHRKERRHT